MAISSKDLDILCYLKKNNLLSNDYKSVIEIGAQQIANNFYAPEKLAELANTFNINSPFPFENPKTTSNIVHGNLEHLEPDALPAKYFWKWLGLSYKSIDISGDHDSISLDLNYDSLPRKHKNKYDIVTNFGTTEHIANQLNAFKVIHELTAINGIMIHNLPAQGMLNHGLVNYNPKFFWMLARSNNYKWLYFDFESHPIHYDLPQNIIENLLPYHPNVADKSINYKFYDSHITVVLKKQFNQPYVAPIDVETGTTVNNRKLKKRYWSVFGEVRG